MDPEPSADDFEKIARIDQARIRIAMLNGQIRQTERIGGIGDGRQGILAMGKGRSKKTGIPSTWGRDARFNWVTTC